MRDVGRTRKGEIMFAWFSIAVILFIVIRWPTWFVLTAIALFILICWPIARPLLLMVVSVLAGLVYFAAVVLRIGFLQAWLNPLAEWLDADSKRDI